VLSFVKKLTTNAVAKITEKQVMYLTILIEYLLEIVIAKVKNQTKKVIS
jgi:hypothetical protein